MRDRWLTADTLLRASLFVMAIASLWLWTSSAMAEARADRRPATPSQVKAIRDLLGMDPAQGKRKDLLDVTATPDGWMCGRARDPEERDIRGRPMDPAFNRGEPFVYDPVTGRLRFPFDHKDETVDELEMYNAHCPGRIAH